MSRKTAREVAMKLAFAKLLGGDGNYEEVLALSGIEDKNDYPDMDFADTLIVGTQDHQEELDQIILELSIGWTIERMPYVDLCILRIAVYEMLYCDNIPYSVSINEAVELAKIFGGDKSASYVNGVLGGIARQYEEKEEKK